jgi:hypothetical protein
VLLHFVDGAGDIVVRAFHDGALIQVNADRFEAGGLERRPDFIEIVICRFHLLVADGFDGLQRLFWFLGKNAADRVELHSDGFQLFGAGGVGQ